MNGADREVIALLRCIVIQAARDGELQLVNRSDRGLRQGIHDFLRNLAMSGWHGVIQTKHQPALLRAAGRFVEEGETELAIVMFATAVEHWLNGMIEIGLRRRGERLRAESERGHLESKLTTRWNELFSTPFPGDLRASILALARARNDFVHYKWPMHTESEQDIHRSAQIALAHDAPRLMAELEGLENSIVFDGARMQLDRVLDQMELLDIDSIRH